MRPATIAIILMGLGMAGCSASGSGGAMGAAPERYMGVRPNVNGTWDGTTSSSSMLKQRMKQDSANGATSGGAITQY